MLLGGWSGLRTCCHTVLAAEFALQQRLGRSKETSSASPRVHGTDLLSFDASYVMCSQRNRSSRSCADFSSTYCTSLKDETQTSRDWRWRAVYLWRLRNEEESTFSGRAHRDLACLSSTLCTPLAVGPAALTHGPPGVRTILGALVMRTHALILACNSF